MCGRGYPPSTISDVYLNHDFSMYYHLRIICYGRDGIPTHRAYRVDLYGATVDVTESGWTTAVDSTIMESDWR